MNSLIDGLKNRMYACQKLISKSKECAAHIFAGYSTKDKK